MSAEAAALVGLALFAGSTLLLSELRWFRRRPLVDRVAPYVAGGADRPPARRGDVGGVVRAGDRARWPGRSASGSPGPSG